MNDPKIRSVLLGFVALAAEFFVSFPLIRMACFLVLLGFFVAIACDAFLNRAQKKADEIDFHWTVVNTPHLIAASVVLFAMVVGFYIGLA